MVFAIRRQSHKKQDFCRKNFPDKARKSRQFSSLQQMHIKGGFARFCASACSIGSAYNRCPKFGTFRIVRKFSRSPQHITRSSGLFLDYMDTFSRLSRHCLDRTETFQIIHTLFRLSDTLFRFTGHF